MKKFFSFLLVSSFLVACAGGQFTNSSTTIKPAYVSPAIYMNLSCNELEREAAELISKAPELENEIDKIKKDNDVWISTGAVLFLPLLAGMKPNKEQAEELAQIRGNLVAVKEAAMRKSCRGAGYIPQWFSVYESYVQLNVAFFPAEYDKNCREKLLQKLKPKL